MDSVPVPRPSLVDTVADRLRADLDAGKYRPGDRLPTERNLAAQFGVARHTVKQALSRLEQLGFIETKHGFGSRVRSESEGAGAGILRWLVGLGDPKWIDDLFAARRLIGPIVARQAATNASDLLRESLQTLIKRLRWTQDAETAHKLENEIHRTLAEATNNRVLHVLAQAMIRGYAPVRPLLHRVFANPNSIADDLERVVDAVVAGDAQRAERAAQNYFDVTGPKLRAALKKRK